MALSTDPAAIRHFVLDALRLAGAAYSEADGELVLATCQVTVPGGIFTGPRVVQEQLQLVFTAEGAARHPSAELVCPGSYRLQWFIAGLRARGFLTRQYYAMDFNSKRLEREVLSLLPQPKPRFSFRNERRSYVPFLLAVVKLTAAAGDKREELLPLALNLVDGSLRPELPDRLRRSSFVPELQYQRVERRRLPWKAVWQALQTMALERARSYGTEWYREALERLAAEGEQLHRYYRESLPEAEDPDHTYHEYLRRREELMEKYSPTVRISLANAALLYLPAVVFAVEGHDGRPLPPIRYEPAAGRVEWEGMKA